MTEDKDEKNLERWQPSDNDRTQSEKALRKAGEQMADLQTGIRAAMEQFAEQWEEARAKLAAAFERINIVIAPPIPDIEKAKVVFREHGFCIAPRRSTLLTTNLAFSEWVQVFGDAKLTTALLDRLGHHSHILTTRGSSYRSRNKPGGKEERSTTMES